MQWMTGHVSHSNIQNVGTSEELSVSYHHGRHAQAVVSNRNGRPTLTTHPMHSALRQRQIRDAFRLDTPNSITRDKRPGEPGPMGDETPARDRKVNVVEAVSGIPRGERSWTSRAKSIRGPNCCMKQTLTTMTANHWTIVVCTIGTLGKLKCTGKLEVGGVSPRPHKSVLHVDAVSLPVSFLEAWFSEPPGQGQLRIRDVQGPDGEEQ